MLISREEPAAITQQAVAEYPNECCGVILVRGAERRHVPCRNVQDQIHARDPVTFPRTARNAYYMDPLDALRLNRMVDEGFAFAVIYHSHPNAGAYFSETDRSQALIKGEPAYPGAVYVVVSVVGRAAKAFAAYRWNAERRVFERADAGDLGPGESAASRRLLAAAEHRIPGGVNSPVRAFRSVGGEPRFVARAEGARLWDADGRAYLDFVGSWGPLVLGHAPRAVVEAVTAAAAGGTSYGAPTRQEVELAEAIATAYPSMELVRLVSSGTEAAMSAIRVARSEEHTSELQSRLHLVCRLLLEKKKNTRSTLDYVESSSFCEFKFGVNRSELDSIRLRDLANTAVVRVALDSTIVPRNAEMRSTH